MTQQYVKTKTPNCINLKKNKKTKCIYKKQTTNTQKQTKNKPK